MLDKINYNIPIVDNKSSRIQKFFDGFFYYGHRQYSVISSKGAELKLQETKIPHVAKQNVLKIALLFTGIVPLFAAIYKLVRIAKWHSYKKITVEPPSSEIGRIDRQRQTQLSQAKSQLSQAKSQLSQAQLDSNAAILKTLKSLEERVKNNDPQAMFELGLIKGFGIGVPQEDNALDDLVDRAAEAKHPAAMVIKKKGEPPTGELDSDLFLEIAKIHCRDPKNKEERSKALNAYKPYINYGTLAGQYAAVGALVLGVTGDEPDYKLAEELANHGIGIGMAVLLGSPSTGEEKEALFKKWADQNDLNAKFFYAMLVTDRDKKAGMELLKKALQAAGSDPLLKGPMIKLMNKVLDEEPKDMRIEWYTYCIEQGDKLAILELGKLGQVKENLVKLRELADQGNEEAIEMVHRHYMSYRDLEAVKWIDTYEARNSVYALTTKGDDLVRKNELELVKKGMEYLKRAGEKDAEAMDRYAMHLRFGFSNRGSFGEYLLPPSMENAKAWYQECIEKGRFVEKARKGLDNLNRG